MMRADRRPRDAKMADLIDKRREQLPHVDIGIGRDEQSSWGRAVVWGLCVVLMASAAAWLIHTFITRALP